MVNYVYFDFSFSLLFFHFVNCSETTSTFLILGIERYINAVVIIVRFTKHCVLNTTVILSQQKEQINVALVKRNYGRVNLTSKHKIRFRTESLLKNF